MPPAGQLDDAAIREQAYYFWEQDGRPDGRETEHWMRAVVALSDKAEMDTLLEPAPRKAARKQAKVAAAPVKTAAAKKGKR